MTEPVRVQPMTEAELVQIEQRVAMATAGPWEIAVEGGDQLLRAPGVRGALMCDTQYYPWTFDRREDWAFVANARQDVPALIAELRRSWGEVRVLGRALGLIQANPALAAEVCAALEADED